jgi:hypothetical protein
MPGHCREKPAAASSITVRTAHDDRLSIGRRPAISTGVTTAHSLINGYRVVKARPATARRACRKNKHFANTSTASGVEIRPMLNATLSGGLG